METISSWEEVPNSFKIVLLKHWFIVYSTIQYEKEDYEMFDEIVNLYPDKVFESIVSFALVTQDIGTLPITMILRTNKIEKLFDNILDKSLLYGSDRIMYESLRLNVFEEIITSYYVIQNMYKENNNDDDDTKRTR